MLEISNKADGASLTMVLSGRVDTVTAPELDAAIEGIPADVMALTLDLADVEYISSAGLRVLLKTKKAMDNRGGTFAVANVPTLIQETFEMTGLSEIMLSE